MSQRRKDRRPPENFVDRTFVDDRGRVDKTWRKYPTSELPIGHRRGANSKGYGKGIHMQHIVEDKLAPNPLFGGELMPVIPEIGYVRHRRGDMEIGRGRWDTKNDIFRCIIPCPACNQDTCNQRMWTMYEGHSPHLCKGCHRDAGGRYSD